MHSGGYFFIIHFGLQIQSQKDYPSESMKEWQRNFLKRLIKLCKECVDLLINKVYLQESEDIMSNLRLLNELAFSYQKDDKLEEMNDGINEYFQCLTECDDTTQSCKRICKELLV